MLNKNTSLLQVFSNCFSLRIDQNETEKILNLLKLKTEGKTGEPKSNCEFIGEFQSDNFRIQKKFDHFNGFRPEIVGKMEDESLMIRIQLNRFAFVFLFIGYLMIIIAFYKHPMPFFASVLIWSGFWYLAGWAMYSMDYKKTEKALKEIITKNRA